MSKIVQIYGASRRSQEDLLLDLYPADAGYSIFKIRASYTGACITVRRSTDDEEMDIAFVNGKIDTTSLLSFVGSGDGFVSAWYDQSLFERHLFETVLNQQPRIVHNGNLELLEGEPCLYGDGFGSFGRMTAKFDFPTGDIEISTFCVSESFSGFQNDSIYGVMPNIRVNDRRHIGYFCNDSGTVKSIRLNGGNIRYSSSDSGQLLYTAIYTGGGGAFDARINSNDLSVVGTNNAGLNIQQDSAICLFNLRAGSNDYNSLSRVSGKIQELLVYFDDETTNKENIENDINQRYEIY